MGARKGNGEDDRPKKRNTGERGDRKIGEEGREGRGADRNKKS